jgi:hypothetical protein
MALIVRILINEKQVRCYYARRTTHTSEITPRTTNTYEVGDCSSRKVLGTVTHNYNDSPEVLAQKVLALT